MATTTNPPKTEVAEWCKVFHTQGTENYTSSLTFIKQLTVFALSTVTYLKDVFPKDCYIVESFAGHNIKILKTKCKDELAQFVITSLTRAFEALDKKYLHQLAFCLYDGECIPGNLLEYHIFEYSYTPGGVDLNMHYKNRGEGKNSIKCSAQDVRNQTIKLFKSFLVTMEACPRGQPSISGVSLRLYYNDDAPEDYQAPGYCHDQAKDPLEDTVSEGFEVGCVETPYHKTVAMSYYVKDMFQESSREAIPSANTPMMTASMQEVDFNGKHSIQARYCNTTQHAACFGVPAERVSRLRTHCCADCADRDPQRVPTDPRLAQLSAHKREPMCIFRRILEWCLELDSIDGKRLVDRFGLSAVSATRLMKLLNSYGIVRLPNADLVTSSTIHPEKLQAQISKYFQNDEETNLAERLLAETFASQESNHTDPIAQVLSPVETNALHNTSTLGRVIENPELNKKKSTDDTTMQQYREAILSGEPVCEDMPLAGSSDVENMLKRVKTRGKRKLDACKEKPEKQPSAGVRSKRVKRSNK